MGGAVAVDQRRQHGAHTVLGRTRRRRGSNLAHHLDWALLVAGLSCRSQGRDGYRAGAQHQDGDNVCVVCV